MIFSGIFNLPWWAYPLIALGLTHVTIAAVTIYLHRHQTHRALDLHPAVSHLFRFWLWLTTGMETKEWVAVHRKHHAHVETPADPHSPQIHGIARVLWGGVFLYVRESRDREVQERYGRGTPDDWLETHVYTRCSYCGLILMGLVDVVAFGLVWGLFVLAIQLVWIPFWAAGVINGMGHYWGYRNYPVEDASTNLFPVGILIGGEEFHNNHHAFPTSAKLSSTWYEFDIGWMYIRLLELLGLARVNRIAPVPRFKPDKTECDAETVQAVITHRYYVMAQYTRLVRSACRQEIARLRHAAAQRGTEGLDAIAASRLLRWLRLHTWDRSARRPLVLDPVVRTDPLFHTVYSMRQELSALWSRSTARGSATADQLLQQLCDWRARAESSGIAALREFARRLPHLV
ncbi:MAG TPA: fatty acid desaturase [Burkholderiaceae bacterium]|nr:fatty acid desaturase [Burkholderiaceae bacterium]